ncbi:hypothetical protein PAEPH01_1722 [Pancytospora epiphaga]|nr:hypothetical protein PAEPH01_1722 [Pancytospora epiphaga]
MFKDQLEEIRKTRKTLLHQGKSLIHFVDDDTVDVHTLLGVIDDKIPYINTKALLFERHRLSEKENTVFNGKFSVFLRGLIKNMNSSQIDSILEFLVRIYHVDTYNTHELLFLILPFKQYEAQIRVLMGNASFGSHVEMKEYSIRTIAKLFLEDPKLTSFLSDYFKHYNVLFGFLDPLIGEITKIVKGSNYNCLNEFYLIFVNLIATGHQRKVLEIYHSMREYLDSDEFVNLLLPHYDRDVIKQITPPVAVESVYEEALRNHSGRKLLSNKQKIIGYLKFCNEKGVFPVEFNRDEFILLSHTYLGTEEDIRSIEIVNIAEMYASISNRLEFLEVIFSHPSIEVLFTYMNDDEKAYFTSKCDKFYSNFLTDKNHGLIVRNMTKSVFVKNYNEILSICLEFLSFDCSLFETFVMSLPSSDVGKSNLINLARHHSRCLVNDLLPHSANGIYLSYLLNEEYNYSVSTVVALLENVKGLKHPKLILEACTLVRKCGSLEQNRDFCSWAISQGYSLAALSSIEHNANNISIPDLITAAKATLSSCVIKNLLDRDVGIAELAFEENRQDILLQIAKIAPVTSLFVNHSSTFGFIADNFEILPDHPAIIKYCADNISSKDAFRCIMKGYSHLITLRQHISWKSIKMIIMDSDATLYIANKFLDFIIENLCHFSGDSDIFAWIFASSASLSREQIEKIVEMNLAPGADLINEYVKTSMSEMLQLVPIVVPMLIKYRKESVKLFFTEFKDILHPYAGLLLSHYPEQASLLTCLSSQYALKEAVLYLMNNFSSPSGEMASNLLTIIRNILSKNRCNVKSVFRILAQFLQSNLVINDGLEDIYRLFIRFYIRSCGEVSNSFVGELLLKMASDKILLFLELAKEYLGENSNIFVETYNHAAEHMLLGDWRLVTFATAFLHRRPEFLGNNGLLLCKKAYEFGDTSSLEFIASLCTANGSLVSELGDFIRTAIVNEHELIYSLTLLAFLFKNVPAFKAYRESILPLSAVLSESVDEQIAAKARVLHESLQLL